MGCIPPGQCAVFFTERGRGDERGDLTELSGSGGELSFRRFISDPLSSAQHRHPNRRRLGLAGPHTGLNKFDHFEKQPVGGGVIHAGQLLDIAYRAIN
jgi:hypothetical protein